MVLRLADGAEKCLVERRLVRSVIKMCADSGMFAEPTTLASLVCRTYGLVIFAALHLECFVRVVNVKD